MVYTYRNDIRKTLIPYLSALSTEEWLRSHQLYPNSIAWVISHIAHSEDYWVNRIGKKTATLLPQELTGPAEILHAYISIRSQTDEVLTSLSEEQLESLVEVPVFSDGWRPPSVPTWRWLFHHVYQHEAYHVGQIAVIARLNGINPPHF